MKFVALFYALLPLCLGQDITDADCMNAFPFARQFEEVTSGSNLRVCARDQQQCCSQAVEDIIGTSLSLNAVREIDPDFVFGYEILAARDAAVALYGNLTALQNDLAVNVIQVLMNGSVSRQVADQQFDDFDGTIIESVQTIMSSLSGNAANVNMTEVLITYLMEGFSEFHFNLTFSLASPDAEQTTCGTSAIFNAFFAPEQVAISNLGYRLQRISEAFQVARNAIARISDIAAVVMNFNVSDTCIYIWTKNYACPICAGQPTPLCGARCNEVLLGCYSPLQQVIVQLNDLLYFARGTIQNMLSSQSSLNINLNNIDSAYAAMFNTYNVMNRDSIDNIVIRADCGLGKRKRSIDGEIRQKRQSISFPTVSIDSTLADTITELAMQPALQNISLMNDRTSLCTLLRANASSTSCTIGVGMVTSYTSTFDMLEIADQVKNPAGTFNTSQLRYQARNLPYVLTQELNRTGVLMLYNDVLPGRPQPDLSFLNAADVTPTSTTTTPRPTGTPRGGGGGGGATAISVSMLTTLAGLLFARVL